MNATLTSEMFRFTTVNPEVRTHYELVEVFGDVVLKNFRPLQSGLSHHAKAIFLRCKHWSKETKSFSIFSDEWAYGIDIDGEWLIIGSGGPESALRERAQKVAKEGIWVRNGKPVQEMLANLPKDDGSGTGYDAGYYVVPA